MLIAHVITGSRLFGGAQRNTLLTVTGLARDGYPTELVCGHAPRLTEAARAGGVVVHVVPALGRRVAPARDARALLALYRLFRARRYDVVHTHSFKAGLLGRLAARAARVPRVLHTNHGVPFEITRDLKSRLYVALERRATALSDRVICVGDGVREEMLAWAIGPAGRLVTIHSGIEFATCAPRRTPAEVRDALGLRDVGPIVVSVGRLCEQKAQRYLVEAAARLVPRHPRLRLLLVGDGEDRVLLAGLVDRLRLHETVRLLGERADVADLLQLADVYAMSSQWEGVGRALTEAMVCGRPVVATPVNGVRDLVIHEETGLLAPVRDAAGLAAAIDRLLIDPPLAARLGEAARRHARALMDAGRMVERIERVYDECLDRPERLATAGRAA
jgi:glycosyltransferase involved in cell wall biosynthesis